MQYGKSGLTTLIPKKMPTIKSNLKKIPQRREDSKCNDELKRYADELRKLPSISGWDNGEGIYEKLPEDVACWILHRIEEFDFDELTFDDSFIETETFNKEYSVSIIAMYFATNIRWGRFSQRVNREVIDGFERKTNGQFIRCGLTVRVGRDGQEGDILLLHKACSIPIGELKFKEIKEKTDWRR